MGDPVLRTQCEVVTTFDKELRTLVADLAETMLDAPGVGLAAPQIGVQKRLFVYEVPDSDEGPKTIINPVISDARGEWEYEEGCLSVPGLFFPIVRPKEIHITGFDLSGREVSIEADELMARLFQHELDHLDGRLLFEYLDAEQRKAAFASLRTRNLI